MGDVFLRLWEKGVERYDELIGIEWEWLSLDGAMTKAPLGGEDTGSNPTDRRTRSAHRHGHRDRGHALEKAVDDADCERAPERRAIHVSLCHRRQAHRVEDFRGKFGRASQ